MSSTIVDVFELMRGIGAARGEHFMRCVGRPDHFLVRGDRIVGLIDVHDAKPGDGGMDLGTMGVLDEQMEPNVRAGYASDSEEEEELDELIPFYRFLRRLAAAEWHGRFGPAPVARRALRLANADPYGASHTAQPRPYRPPAGRRSS